MLVAEGLAVMKCGSKVHFMASTLILWAHLYGKN
jgi:hypothetical protein